jgi:hypothetical protein
LISIASKDKVLALLPLYQDYWSSASCFLLLNLPENNCFKVLEGIGRLMGKLYVRAKSNLQDKSHSFNMSQAKPVGHLLALYGSFALNSPCFLVLLVCEKVISWKIPRVTEAELDSSASCSELQYSCFGCEDAQCHHFGLQL